MRVKRRFPVNDYIIYIGVYPRDPRAPQGDVVPGARCLNGRQRCAARERSVQAAGESRAERERSAAREQRAEPSGARAERSAARERSVRAQRTSAAREQRAEPSGARAEQRARAVGESGKERSESGAQCASSGKERSAVRAQRAEPSGARGAYSVHMPLRNSHLLMLLHHAD